MHFVVTSMAHLNVIVEVDTLVMETPVRVSSSYFIFLFFSQILQRSCLTKGTNRLLSKISKEYVMQLLMRLQFLSVTYVNVAVSVNFLFLMWSKSKYL